MKDQEDETTSIYEFLKSLRLFERVDPANLVSLARASWWKQVPKGVFLFFQGDPSDAVYLLRQGAITIRLESPDGRELVINEILPGDCFGELGILTRQPRSTSAEAIVVSEVLLIPRSIFKSVIEQESSLALRLLELTARRLQNSSKREEALAFLDAQQRLARQLLLLTSPANENPFLHLSQEEIAQRTGLTRQTVATILGRWRRRGWLLTGRGRIEIINRRELDLLVQEFEIKGDIKP